MISLAVRCDTCGRLFATALDAPDGAGGSYGVYAPDQPQAGQPFALCDHCMLPPAHYPPSRN